MKLDTVRTVGTPEGATLELRLAGPLVRILAWSVDLLVRSLVYIFFGVALGLVGTAGSGFLMLVVFLGEWFYPVIFELRMDGATPGKRVYGLAVIHADGTRVGWRASVVRNLIRFGDFLPFAYLAGLTSMVLSRDFQRLGDLIAGTVVIHNAKVSRPKAKSGIAALAPPVPLTLEEQRAIIDFSERSERLSKERRRELAMLAEPLLGNAVDRPVTRLRAIAAWLVGER